MPEALDIPSEVLTAQVVRNLRDGDFVWVTVDESLEDEETSSVQDVIGSLLPEGVSLMVTRGDCIERIKVATLEDLLSIQGAIEAAIRELTRARLIEV